jgi:hypothetical protein
MFLFIQCPKCRRRLKVPDTKAGTMVHCTGCYAALTAVQTSNGTAKAVLVEDGKPLTAPPTAKKVRCGNCGKKLGVSQRLLDKRIRCPVCKAELTPPPKPEPEPPLVPVVESIPCPMCREEIKPGARKCRFCGELFDPKLRAEAEREKRRAQPVRPRWDDMGPDDLDDAWFEPEFDTDDSIDAIAEEVEDSCDTPAPRPTRQQTDEAHRRQITLWIILGACAVLAIAILILAVNVRDERPRRKSALPTSSRLHLPNGRPGTSAPGRRARGVTSVRA